MSLTSLWELVSLHNTVLHKPQHRLFASYPGIITSERSQLLSAKLQIPLRECSLKADTYMDIVNNNYKIKLLDRV